MKIALRGVRPDDVDAMYRWETDPATRRVTFGAASVTRQMLWEYARQGGSDICRDGQLRMIVTLVADDGTRTAVGAVDITDYDPRNRRAQAGIVIDSDFRHRGIGRKALRLLTEYCRRNLGLYQLYAIVGNDNAPSLALFRSAGFISVAQLPDWTLNPEPATASLMRLIL